jgi:hypothetical protein
MKHRFGRRNPHRKCPIQQKACYKTQAKAQKDMGLTLSRTTDNMFDYHTYKCPHCGSWHFGHKSYYLKSLQQ